MCELPPKCPLCGAFLVLDEADMVYYCKYCGWEEPVEPEPEAFDEPDDFLFDP